MQVEIRVETSADSAAIEAVTIAAFRDARYTNHREQHIVAALRAGGKLVVSLVAETDGAVVGHIAISPVSVSDGASGWFGLGPISVLPCHQRKRIGSRLAHAALRLLRERGAAGCVVLGEPQFYARFGFRAEPSLVLPGIPPEYFLALGLGSSRPSGIVTYHEAFNG